MEKRRAYPQGAPCGDHRRYAPPAPQRKTTTGRSAILRSVDEPGRYRVTLTVDDQHVMDGWWDNEETARKKFRATVGDYGRNGARVTLTDTETGDRLASWP